MAESIGHSAEELALITRIEAAGWRLVPVDATPDMVAAGDAISPGQARKVWDAMAAAAPGAGAGHHVE